MKPIIQSAIVAASLGVAACASAPDHFYTLSVLPDTARAVPVVPTVHVLLTVDVPALVDRAEMVISTSGNQIEVLEHQRWAVPLSDQVSQTLARDLEKCRGDVWVADRAFDQGTTPPVKINVDIVRLTAQRAGQVAMEARWHIVDASVGIDSIGGDAVAVAVDGTGYDAIARAYSEALRKLAGRLAADVRPPVHP